MGNIQQYATGCRVLLRIVRLILIPDLILKADFKSAFFAKELFPNKYGKIDYTLKSHKESKSINSS